MVAQLVLPVTDLSINVIVTMYLVNSNSRFNSNTETVLKKLLTVTWSAGIPPTISATLDMITFLTMQVRMCGPLRKAPNLMLTVVKLGARLVQLVNTQTVLLLHDVRPKLVRILTLHAPTY